jgi:hypothetical protein
MGSAVTSEKKIEGARACSNLRKEKKKCGHAVTLGKKRGGIRECSNLRK